MTQTSKRLLAAGRALVLGVGLAGLGCGEDDAAPGADGTVTVTRRTFASTVMAIGAVKPRIGAEVRVGSRLSGRVRRLRANIGDRVAKGQVIAELETGELDAVVAQREAEVRLADARLVAVDTLSPEGQARTRAEVARAEATLKLAGADWDRQQQLLRDGGTTAAEADGARERYLVAQAEVASARRDLDLTQSAAAAEHARAQAALAHARVELSFAVISAPIGGTIASISTQEGETVAAGLSAPTFVTIIDLARLQVHAYVDEVDIGKVTSGQHATFSVDAFPARDFEGTVAAIYPTATIQDNVVKYVVALDIADDSAGLLRPEMTASVRVHLESRELLAVPARALRREAGGTVVYLLKNGQAETQPVRAGWRDGPWVEIIEGLAEGDVIALDPPANARTEQR